MTTKILLGAVAVLLVAGATYGVLVQTANAPTGKTPESYSWTFQDKTTDQAQPRTQVSIVAEGKARAVGTYDGSCSEIDTDLLPFEQSKVVCWFAGGGKEIGLFNEDGQWSVQVGDLDEGSAEIEGFRGNFKTLITF